MNGETSVLIDKIEANIFFVDRCLKNFIQAMNLSGQFFEDMVEISDLSFTELLNLFDYICNSYFEDAAILHELDKAIVSLRDIDEKRNKLFQANDKNPVDEVAVGELIKLNNEIMRIYFGLSELGYLYKAIGVLDNFVLAQK